MNEELKKIIIEYVYDADDVIGGIEDFVDAVNEVTEELYEDKKAVVTVESIKGFVKQLAQEMNLDDGKASGPVS